MGKISKRYRERFFFVKTRDLDDQFHSISGVFAVVGAWNELKARRIEYSHMVISQSAVAARKHRGVTVWKHTCMRRQYEVIVWVAAWKHIRMQRLYEEMIV